MADESLVEAIKTLRRDVEQLQRQLAATRAWCLGLEEEQTRLGAMLQGAGWPTGGYLDAARIEQRMARNRFFNGWQQAGCHRQ